MEKITGIVSAFVNISVAFALSGNDLSAFKLGVNNE
jgi:hypothetical protein